MSNASCKNANFQKANLIEADLSNASVVNACLHDARLAKADLSGADLRNADLNGADLEGANLEKAVLIQTSLNGASLIKTNLWWTYFSLTEFRDTNLSHASMNLTVFSNVDLASAVGLDTCVHEGPSSIDTHTLQQSGPLPQVFLRGCGLPDRLIEYLPSIFDAPIQLHSCFISFTEADQEFAQRIYNDLQGKGVRCWRWKEDAKGGRSLIGQVDLAVRLYDKLIVVCSENSMKSNLVIREIERALQREDRLVAGRQMPEVLFPIRLDDAIFAWEHPRAADVREKFISDFTGWKDHNSYRKAFDRLLRDLVPDPE